MKVVWLLLVVVLVGAGCSAGDSPSSDVGGVSSLPVVPGDVTESVPQVVESTAAEPTPTPTLTPTPSETEPEVDVNGVVVGEYPTRDQIDELGSVATCGYYEGPEDLCLDSDEQCLAGLSWRRRWGVIR